MPDVIFAHLGDRGLRVTARIGLADSSADAPQAESNAAAPQPAPADPEACHATA